MRLLEDNIGENLSDLGFGSEFLHAAPKAWSMKKKKLIGRTSLKWKKLLFCENTVKRIKRKSQTGRKYLQNISDKELVSKMCKELSQNSTIRKETTQLKKGKKIWIDTSTKKIYRW